jgi:leader peptidase (prepilin peptidase) / N-methyltransferase
LRSPDGVVSCQYAMELNPYFVGVAIFLFGLIIGSFLNVVIYRLPRRESVVFPSSHCPSCNTAIKAYDNIPVFSYAVLGGRCRNCRTSISPLYPAVELLVAILYLLAYINNDRLAHTKSEFELVLMLLADIVFLSLLVPLIFIDLQHKILPNKITYPGFVIMLVLRALAPDPVITASTRNLFHLTGWSDHAVALLGAALGAAIGGGSLWLVRWLYFRLRSVEGMGIGDIKMMLMVGAFLGWQLTMLTIFIGSLLGAVIGILLIKLRGGNMKMEIPFGVFLGPAAIISLFVGQPLIAWYVTLYR